MQRSMSVVDYRRFNRLRRFMEEVPNAENIVPKDCKSCECYQPNRKYRTCLYARCKYNKPINVFRDKPMPIDVIPNPYWELRDIYELASDIFGW